MKLNQVTVGTTDYAASVDYYRRLGLRQIVDSPPLYARFETPSGETFSIHRIEAVASTTIVYFEVEDVDRFVAGLDLPLAEAPADRPWLEGPNPVPEVAVIGRGRRLGRRAPPAGPGSPAKAFDATSRLPRPTAQRRAGFCRPDVVARRSQWGLHCSLLAPRRTTKSDPSRPPPGLGLGPMREARLFDPCGNEICLYQAGENRRFPPWRITGD